MAVLLSKPADARLLTIAETAKFLRIGQRTLEGMIANGRFPVIRLSKGLIRIDPRDIRLFVDSHKKPLLGDNIHE
ncbi:MAG: helix-turn-helix domain-containing protein [Phycisphaeraceae bacterium]|nr:helix-turn-helix domain-containing protein [Phycisphaeraceae bacterium]